MKQHPFRPDLSIDVSTPVTARRFAERKSRLKKCGVRSCAKKSSAAGFCYVHLANVGEALTTPRSLRRRMFTLWHVREKRPNNGSRRIITWKFLYRRTAYSIALQHCSFTETKCVFVGNTKVHEEESVVGGYWSHEINLQRDPASGKYGLSIVIVAYPGTKAYEYDILVNGDTFAEAQRQFVRRLQSEFRRLASPDPPLWMRPPLDSPWVRTATEKVTPLKFTTVRVEWKFTLVGKAYSVVLEHAYLSGTRKVFIDGELALTTKFTFFRRDSVATSHVVMVGGICCTVMVLPYFNYQKHDTANFVAQDPGQDQIRSSRFLQLMPSPRSHAYTPVGTDAPPRVAIGDNQTESVEKSPSGGIQDGDQHQTSCVCFRLALPKRRHFAYQLLIEDVPFSSLRHL